jgi:hypothetical protein
MDCEVKRLSCSHPLQIQIINRWAQVFQENHKSFRLFPWVESCSMNPKQFVYIAFKDNIPCGWMNVELIYKNEWEITMISTRSSKSLMNGVTITGDNTFSGTGSKMIRAFLSDLPKSSIVRVRVSDLHKLIF